MVFERTLVPFAPLAGEGRESIKVEIDWEGRSWLYVVFRASGFADGIRLPIPESRTRRDDLWKHTCCEVFALRQSGDYVEFNLSPSGDWAAYAFSGYRADMRNLEVSAPDIKCTATEDGFELAVVVNWSEWPFIDSIGLSVVVEMLDGSKTCWALTHPSDKPDFHHADSFALTSPALEQP